MAEEGPALLWAIDAGGQACWFGGAWLPFTGLATDDLLGDGWLACVHPDDVERTRGIRQASLAASMPFSLDVRLRRHDGVYRWMLDCGTPRIDADGRLAGYCGSSVDISERKVLEDGLARHAETLRLTARRQARRLAHLAHELRNPLAPIANTASMLKTMEADTPLLGKLREILERQVARLSHLIGEVPKRPVDDPQDSLRR